MTVGFVALLYERKVNFLLYSIRLKQTDIAITKYACIWEIEFGIIAGSLAVQVEVSYVFSQLS
jgi:hypothetical protein